MQLFYLKGHRHVDSMGAMLFKVQTLLLVADF
jgi:hypothetical protein